MVKRGEFVNTVSNLCDLQHELDETIILNMHDSNNYNINKMILACNVEFAEFLQEMPSIFKFWKKTAKDNKENALEELADTLHFALSIFNYDVHNNRDFHLKEIHKIIENSHMSLEKACIHFTETLDLSYLFYIAEKSGFSFHELVEAYKKKRQVNFERIANKY